MKTVASFIALCCASMGVFAQTAAPCVAWDNYKQHTASLWFGKEPDTTKPFPTIDGCRVSENGFRTTCIALASSTAKAVERAQDWLQTIRQCEQLSTIPQAKAVELGFATHYVMDLGAIEYRGQTLKHSVRVQEEHVAGKGKSAKKHISTTLTTTVVPTDRKRPEQQICDTIDSLLNEAALKDQWLGWQGPKTDKIGETQHYMCAKVPYGLKSRFDCSVQIHPNMWQWTARWTWPMTYTESLPTLMDDMAKSIASCTPGLVHQTGQYYHRIDAPTKAVRMELQGVRNDVGRGPSATLTIRHWTATP